MERSAFLSSEFNAFPFHSVYNNLATLAHPPHSYPMTSLVYDDFDYGT